MSSRSKKKAKRLNQNRNITTKGISIELISSRPQNKSVVLQSSGNNIDIPRCGLCGKTENLTKTECCGNWICDDEENYVLGSLKENSCHRNHRRLTLCGQHYESDHKGKWQDCEECKTERNIAEMYVHFATNEYNFEKLKNPPRYEPTRCVKCNNIIVLSDGGWSYQGGYVCFNCLSPELKRVAMGIY